MSVVLQDFSVCFCCCILFVFVVVLFVRWSWLDTLTLTVQYVTKGQTLKKGYRVCSLFLVLLMKRLEVFQSTRRQKLWNHSVCSLLDLNQFLFFYFLNLDLVVVYFLIQQPGLLKRCRHCALAAYWYCVAATWALKRWTEAGTTHSVFVVNLRALCNWMRMTRNSSFSVHSPSDVHTYLVSLLTQTNKRQRLQLGSEGDRISHHCSVRCIRKPSDTERLEKPANYTCNRTAKTSEIAVL